MDDIGSFLTDKMHRFVVESEPFIILKYCRDVVVLRGWVYKLLDATFVCTWTSIVCNEGRVLFATCLLVQHFLYYSTARPQKKSNHTCSINYQIIIGYLNRALKTQLLLHCFIHLPIVALSISDDIMFGNGPCNGRIISQFRAIADVSKYFPLF